MPLPAPITDLEAQTKTFGPTINKSTGLPFGWKREVRRHGTGAQEFFDIIVTNPDGRFVFRRKSQLRKFCEVWSIPTMGINANEVFTFWNYPRRNETS